MSKSALQGRDTQTLFICFMMIVAVLMTSDLRYKQSIDNRLAAMKDDFEAAKLSFRLK